MDTKQYRCSGDIDSEDEPDICKADETDEQLYREVRDILSELTSANFEKYLIKIRSLKIDTCEKLHGVVNLLFDEIVNYKSCALLCKELVLMPLLKSEEVKKKFGLEVTTFRMLLHLRCETELKKMFSEDEYLITLMYNDELLYILEKENEFRYEDKHFEKQLKESSVILIKFLVELHRQSVITSDIMMKFMADIIADMGFKYNKCINYVMFAVGEELRKDSVRQQTLESKVIQRADNKNVPNEPSNGSAFKEVMENNRQIDNKNNRRVYTLEELLRLRYVLSSTKLPENYGLILSLNLNSVPRKSKKSPSNAPTVQTDIQEAEKLHVRTDQEKNESDLESTQSSEGQPVQSFVSENLLTMKEEIHKTVNKTITKLTSSSLKSTVDMILSLKVNIYPCVMLIIETIMERATHKPESCALLCKELDRMEVRESTTFRDLLLAKCVEDLYNVPSFTEDDIIQNEISLSLKLKHVGLVQFMRELHKHQIITDQLVVECIAHLLKNWPTNKEGYLECVCRLLLLFGEELEIRKVDLNSYFNTLTQIRNNKQEKLSDVLRFFSQSLQDLRNAKWSQEKREICQIFQTAYNPRITLTEVHKVTLLLFEKQTLKQIKTLKIDTYAQLIIVVEILISRCLVCPEFCAQICVALLPVKVPNVCNKMYEIVNIRKILRRICEEEIRQPDFTTLKPDFSKFIGHLFEKELILDDIVVKCVAKLLVKVDELCLVYVHDLLLQVGEQLEKNGIDMSPHYNRINRIVRKKHGNISNKVLIKLDALVARREALLVLNETERLLFQTNPPNNDNRKKYMLVENHKENKSDSESSQSSAAQSVQSLTSGKPVKAKKDEFHKTIVKTINNLNSSSIESTVDMIASHNTYEYVMDVIDILMERTNKAENCALLCKELVRIKMKTVQVLEGRTELTTFHQLLLARCSEDFYNVPSSPTEENLSTEYEELRLKHVGLVRFMRELHKHQILPDTLVVEFLEDLTKNWRTNREGNMECVCRLLLLFGEELEVIKVDLNPYFNILKQVCNDKQQKISDLLRFISQSLHELRKAKWSPEKQEICEILQNAYNPSRLKTTELHGITSSLLKKQKLGSPKVLLKMNTRTYEQLKEVVKIIFSYAPSRPEICVQLCLELLPIKVPCIKNNSFEIVDIRRILYDKCQQEAGTPRFTKFIGHLYEKELITSDIVVKCVARLLTNNVKEQCLVCVHDLLLQVGEQLEKNGTDMTQHYNRINRIVQNGDEQISTNLLIKLNGLVTRWKSKFVLNEIQPTQFHTVTNQPNYDVQQQLLGALGSSMSSTNSTKNSSQTVPEHTKGIMENGIQTVQIKDVGILPNHPQIYENLSLPFLRQNDNHLPSTSKFEDTSHRCISFTEIHQKLGTFFSMNTPTNEVIEWIQTNIGEAKEGEIFVRALMTAILEQCVVNNKLNDQKLKNYYPYLHRLYIGSPDTVEVYCLYGVQTFFYKMGLPDGLLLTTFRKLYEDSVILPESFLTWKACTDPTTQEGKRDALTQLTDFFAELKTTEYEDM